MNGKAQNYGNQVALNGGIEGAIGKLIRVTEGGLSEGPWVLSVSSDIIPAPENELDTPFLGPIVRGTFGSGGVAHKFEIDAKPDSVIGLPGSSVDCDALWDQLLMFDDLSDFTKYTTTRTGLLPIQALVNGTVKHGIPSVANATRTIAVRTNGITEYILTIPAFANEFMWYPGVNGTYSHLDAITLQSGVFDITRYTTAEVKAIRDGGGFIPIPGSATRVRVEINDRGVFFNHFGLNL